MAVHLNCRVYIGGIALIRILIVDDHLLLREGIKCLLGKYDNLHIIAEACDGEQALRVLKTNKFDIVLSDINMPKINGIELVRRVSKMKEETKCIILSAYVDAGFVTAAVKAGARGYVLKSAAPEVIVEAINTVRLGGHYFHDVMPKKLQRLAETTLASLDKLLRQQQNQVLTDLPEVPVKKRPGRKRQSGLTAREIELLYMITKGMRTKEVATQLGLSEKTIKNHLSNIFRKLEVEDRTQAICVALREKILIM